MRVVSGEEVHRLCDWLGLAAALAESHRGPRPLTGRSGLDIEMRGTRQTYLDLPAWLPGIAMGSKLVTVIPDNPDRRRDLPAVQAAYVLFDGDDGHPLALIDGTALTYRKTAADSGLGAMLLAREDPEVLALIGAGGLAPYLARAHLAARPSLAKVLVWNRTPARRRGGRGLARRWRGRRSRRRHRGGYTGGRYRYLLHRLRSAAGAGRMAEGRKPSRSGRRLHPRHARMRRRGRAEGAAFRRFA